MSDANDCPLGYGHGGHWCGPHTNCWLDPRPKHERGATPALSQPQPSAAQSAPGGQTSVVKVAPFTWAVILDGKKATEGSERHCRDWADAWNASPSSVENVGAATVAPLFLAAPAQPAARQEQGDEVRLTGEYHTDCSALMDEVRRLREAADAALSEIQAVMQESYNNATPVCCGRPGMECCGSPDPEWSEFDQRMMDRFAPIERELRAALSASAEGKA